jgi:hypothetical protein
VSGGIAADAAEDEYEREPELFKDAAAIYPLNFNDGFTPAVLEVSSGRQTVRPATPRELALF